MEGRIVIAIAATAAALLAPVAALDSPQVRVLRFGSAPQLASSKPELRGFAVSEAPLETQQRGGEPDDKTEVRVRSASPNPDPGSTSSSTMFPVYFALNATDALNSTDDVSEVTVVGSWSHWSVHFNLLKKGDGTFAGWIDVPQGRHQFKFIADGMMCPFITSNPAFARTLAS